MLGACNRVLKPGGRLVFYVIHFQPGLSLPRKASLIEALPGVVDAPAPYLELIERAGFNNVAERDVTPDYQRTAAKWLREAGEMEPRLRAALGDQVYEDKQANRLRSMAAIDAGDLGRTLFTATAPSAERP